MHKRLILILALAFVVGIAFTAYAEVQNVKVSGDLTVSGVFRNNLDLAKSPVSGSTVNTSTYQDKQEDILSITRLRVDADLTDNVSTTVRLLNERNWNGESSTGVENNRNIGLTGLNAHTSESQIDLDLAYVTMKEFLYSPLTLTVGRQNLRFGNAWIVGDPDTNGAALKSPLAEGDLSARKSFDSIRATLDYSPLVVDVIYSKLAENNSVLNDDTTLAGLNAAYELSKNTTVEGFFFSKVRGSNAAAVTNLDSTLTTSFGDASTNKQKADKVNTAGVRVVNTSIKNLAIDAQAAYQFGTYNPKFDPNARFVSATDKAETSNRSAWGAEVVATYDLKDIAALAKYSPSISGAYVYLSGESRDNFGNKTYHGWDSMFEDQTFGHLINAILGFSNIHLVGLSGQAKPMDDISLKVDWVWAQFAKRYPEGRLAILSGVSTGRQFVMGKSAYLGQEVDATLTYDYTEDVQFSLLGGIFLPGKSINTTTTTGATNRNRVAATELIGSMKVTF